MRGGSYNDHFLFAWYSGLATCTTWLMWCAPLYRDFPPVSRTPCGQGEVLGLPEQNVGDFLGHYYTMIYAFIFFLIYQPENLNNRHLFLTVLKAGKSKIKVQADTIFGTGLLPGLCISAFLLLCAHTAFPSCVHVDRDNSLSSFSHKDTNSIMGAPPCTSPKPNYLPKAQLQIPSYWGLGLQYMNLGAGTQTFSP